MTPESKADTNRGKQTSIHSSLVTRLENIQSQHGYLPEKVLRDLAVKEGKSLVDIYGIATFYRSFSLKPRGKHLVSICLGTACHVRGGAVIAEEFERQLGIRAGETTPNNQFTLETVACLGACALGPIVMVDGQYYSKVTLADVKEIITKTISGERIKEQSADQQDTIPIEVSCSYCNHSLMDEHHPIDGYSSIRVTASTKNNHGWLRLSSVYGSYVSESEIEIDPLAVVHFFCPHCHSELKETVPCTECSAPMISMLVKGGGVVKICTRSGCHGHMLDVNGVNS